MYIYICMCVFTRTFYDGVGMWLSSNSLYNMYYLVSCNRVYQLINGIPMNINKSIESLIMWYDLLFVIMWYNHFAVIDMK